MVLFQCMIQGWYLACDMHFFIIGITLIYLRFKHPKLGSVLIAGSCVAAVAIPSYITYVNNYKAVVQLHHEWVIITYIYHIINWLISVIFTFKYASCCVNVLINYITSFGLFSWVQQYFQCGFILLELKSIGFPRCLWKLIDVYQIFIDRRGHDIV